MQRLRSRVRDSSPAPGFKEKPPGFFVLRYLSKGRRGAIAKRLCTGLQIRVGRFDSGSRLQYFAGVAQLVERNLAKVEVASSRLVSRSKQKGKVLVAYFPFFICRIEVSIITHSCAGGGIGLHTRLKILRRKPYGFESRPAHHKKHETGKC